MIEDVLIQQGVAGAMLVYFIIDKMNFQKGMTKLIENNTIALTKVNQVIGRCKRR